MGPRVKLFVPLIIFAVMALFLFRGLALDPRAMPSALIDHALPDFTLASLGQEQELSRQDVVGEVALFNVWATWCMSCRVEHPYLIKLAGDGVPIYGVNYKDEDGAALDWLATLGNPYRASIVDNEGTLGLDMGVYGAPETYLVDAQGIIRFRHVGVVDERVWNSTLEPLYIELGGKASTR
ncbi:MAG: DsbE family thiol:disulfide interchange protein [Halieaceae bacterium]|jgi:cytochrome c biogenesis protein CcmG, thiol:disulfide interchange protein DsbE|nr:DsbE family thiol:disulfide interchange protein [Halieaceae bacterium]